MASSDCDLLSFKVIVNGSVCIGAIDQGTKTVSVSVPFGTDVSSLTPLYTVSTGAVARPPSGAARSFKSPVSIKVTAEDVENYKYYGINVTVRPDAAVCNVTTPNSAGWINTRNVYGNLSKYTKGGMTIELGRFRPKQVIGLQIDKGYTGYFDIETKKLKVYKACDTEATADDTVFYSFTVIGE